VKKLFPALGVGALLAVPLLVFANAQQPATPEKPPASKPAPEASPRQPIVPLRVQIVISKYRAEKKLSSLPYDLSVNANSGPTRLRIGGDVPIPAGRTQKGDGKSAEPLVSYSFRTIGTSIDCTGFSDDPGRYRLNVSISDDSIAYADEKDPGGFGEIPRFRTFTISNTLLLKDGQTSQMTMAADPITGEVMRVDVTLTVVK
jgi:hypothetical protein